MYLSLGSSKTISRYGNDISINSMLKVLPIEFHINLNWKQHLWHLYGNHSYFVKFNINNKFNKIRVYSIQVSQMLLPIQMFMNFRRKHISELQQQDGMFTVDLLETWPIRKWCCRWWQWIIYFAKCAFTLLSLLLIQAGSNCWVWVLSALSLLS